METPKWAFHLAIYSLVFGPQSASPEVQNFDAAKLNNFERCKLFQYGRITLVICMFTSHKQFSIFNNKKIKNIYVKVSVTLIPAYLFFVISKTESCHDGITARWHGIRDATYATSSRKSRVISRDFPSRKGWVNKPSSRMNESWIEHH